MSVRKGILSTENRRNSTVTFDISVNSKGESAGGEVEFHPDGACGEEEHHQGSEAAGVQANGRGSLVSAGCYDYYSSPRSSADGTSPFEVMARNSLSSLQQRRQSTASVFIREPLSDTNDDRNWSWSYLRERFHIKDLEDLYQKYQLRLHHAMLLVYLLLQLALSLLALLLICVTLPQASPQVEIAAEMTGHGANLVVCVSLLVYVYNEHTFRQFPRLHIVMSGLVVLTLFTTEVALTMYFHINGFMDDHYKDIKYGNMVYLLLVVYVFLPIPRKWQVSVIAVVLSVGDLLLSYYALTPVEDTAHVVTRLCIDALVLVCVNLVGVYWRFMSEVAFRRAFLDKRGNLESKFKLDAEKKQEETLLLSVLPKNIMQQVKSDFRNMIYKTFYKANPISKTNPFPDLYLSYHEMVSILYADIVNFTPLTTMLSGDQLVEMLNDLFGKFDEAAETNDCLRIKILGDCYYCVSGVPEFTTNHAENCVKVGLEMIDIIRDVREERRVNVDMRIGIHSGSVLSGLIGVRKWQFDVWSNDVTIANHMEQTGEAGRIHVTQKTHDLLGGLGYDFKPSNAAERDELLKAEGIDTYLITPKPRRTTRVTYEHSVSIKPRFSVSQDPAHLKNLYEGDMSKKITKVQLPHGASRPSILNRRRSTHTESSMGGKRRTVVMDTSALANFQRIMVNSKEFMEKAIESMPLRKYDQWFKPEGINPLLLTFKRREWELPLLRQPDPLYKYYILCATVVFIAIFVMQELLMPANSRGWIAGVCCLVLLVLVSPLVWVATFHKLIVDPHDDIDMEYDTHRRSPITNFFYASSKTIISSIALRFGLYLVVCVALYACAVVNVLECNDLLHTAVVYYRAQDDSGGGEGALNYTTTTTTPNTIPDTTSSTPYGTILDGTTTTRSYSTTFNSTTAPPDIPPLCCDPWYFTYSTTLTLLVAWTFFRMHFLLKFFIYVIVVSIYGYFVLDFAEVMYTHHHLSSVCPSLSVTSLHLSPGMGHFLFVLMIFLALHMMDRQMEYIMRLDFQWKQQLEEEKKEAETTHFANKLLLQNILPLHVADMYLTRSKPTNELYHESYNHVAVIFASIPNYGEFYREYVNNEEGRMCLRVLNEIISDFDMLTYNVQFLTVEKIKVVGSTYMAACGLQPGRRYSDESSNFEERDKQDNVATLANFAAAMFEKLHAINQEDLQDFRLRVGIDVGPLVAGVVGQHKPMYDIWGNTVNVASRMDYTGSVDKIHVTSEVGKILEELGWSVECRGEIKVKGKGLMTTYFVDPKSAPKGTSGLARPHNINNNNSRKNSQDIKNTRRRSSQISLSSLKSMLSSHRGSLEISSNKRESDTHSTRSLPMYRPVATSSEYSVLPDQGTAWSAGATPRSSIDAKANQNLEMEASRLEKCAQILSKHQTSESQAMGSSEIPSVFNTDGLDMVPSSSSGFKSVSVFSSGATGGRPSTSVRVTFQTPRNSLRSGSSIEKSSQESSQESIHKITSKDIVSTPDHTYL